MGAGKLDRIGKGLKSASLIGFLMSAICFVIAALFGKQLTLLFVDAGETAIIAYSYEFLLFCTGGYCLLIPFVTTGHTKNSVSGKQI